jgi:hypothetical protein
MNDFSEIENQLRKLRPVQPSANLIERIERALAESESTSTAGVIPSERRRLHWNWLSLGLGLAAAAALLLFARVSFDHPVKKVPTVASMTPATTLPPTSMSSGFVPAGLTQVVYRTRDEGLHFPDASGQPMRRVRSQRRETLRWRNPNTGASLRVSYPTEEVELIPISGQ